MSNDQEVCADAKDISGLVYWNEITVEANVQMTVPDDHVNLAR